MPGCWDRKSHCVYPQSVARSVKPQGVDTRFSTYDINCPCHDDGKVERASAFQQVLQTSATETRIVTNVLAPQAVCQDARPCAANAASNCFGKEAILTKAVN
mmetsp:Transcript_41684/g.116136  ORF Transcript_41684/g.116136 Transcript_41684/m.116136 type:complete len:102 (-) Transcript_41684:130-435(-)